MKFTKGQIVVATDICYDGPDDIECIFRVLNDFESKKYVRAFGYGKTFFDYLEKEGFIQRLENVVRTDFADFILPFEVKTHP